MKIKSINIRAFAGIKEKKIDFTDGFNLIYGKNEKGKSTIENFIKIWLYGIDHSRGKLNDRKKYSPLSGEKISGELILEHEGKGYIIKRSFGITKKEDICEILDEITGENVEWNNKNEPGKYLLNLNFSTFMKTLFISQLGITVSKDKEEEIMEKITNIYNTGDENTSVKKIIESLEKRKKQLIGIRKGGELDLLKEDIDSLKTELWQAYKLGEENIDNEEHLIKKKELRLYTKEQIQKLDLYKKYIKKIKLQEDYEEISNYLRKGEELKREQDSIVEELKKGEDYITIELLDEINGMCAKYLSLFDVKQEKLRKLHILEEELKGEGKSIREHSIFSSMGNNVREKIYTLKAEQKNLEEKLNDMINIQNAISRLKMDINKKAEAIENLEFLNEQRYVIEELINSYKEALKELKYKLENQSYDKKKINSKNLWRKIKFIYVISIISILGFLYGVIKQVTPVLIICIPSFILLIKLYLKYSLEIKNNEFINKNKEAVENIKVKISEYEEKLDYYMNKTKSKDYEEFISKLTQYDKFKIYKENAILTLKNKEEEINKYDIAKLKSKFNRNKGVIASLFSVLSCSSLDEVLKKLEDYEMGKEKIIINEYELNGIKQELENINEQLIDKEEEIRKKTYLLNLEDVEIVDMYIKLKEYKEKINKMNEIRNAMQSVEETFRILVKDRNIDEIKEEMKQIVNYNINYSYQSDEEIDDEIRNQSNELLKVEKEIKDLEHLIEKRYFGKREIQDIEEDILIKNEKIMKLEKEFRGLELASDVLQEAFRDVKKNVGPDLNEKVVSKFNALTNGNYEEVKISEEYRLKVRSEGMLLDADLLSNGAKDQLYLALRLSFINMLFKNKEVPIFLDDAFIQYDDERRELALKLLIKEAFEQVIFLTCQKVEEDILEANQLEYKLINLN